MEKPYPDNSGFYGYGALREMGLRKSRHSGDWRSKSMFENKEENFVQPLKGSETVLLRGTNIRGGGGDRQPSTKTGDGEAAEFREPEGGRAPTSHNLAIIRSLGQSLGMPQAVQERRAFEEELASLHQPNAFPEWGLRFIYKIFRTYTTPFPAFSYDQASVRSNLRSCRSASGLQQFQRHILPSGIRLLCFLFHASVRYRPRLVVCILGNLTTRD